MKITKIIALAMSSMLIFTACSSGGGNETNVSSGNDTGYNPKNDTLVLGIAQLNGVFNPFFSTTDYDKQIYSMSISPLIIADREGAPSSHLAKYVEPQEVMGEDGKVTESIYTFELVEGAKFSDGTPVTAEDIIFTYKVLADPTYDGSSTLFTTPIKGINEYRYDDPNYKEKIDSFKKQAEDYKPTDAEITETANKIAQENKMDVKDFLPKGEYYESGTIVSLKTDKYKALESNYIKENLSKSELSVPEIEGVQKINDTTVQVTINGVDPKAIWNLGGVYIAPKSYYGESFKKGDLESVRSKNSSPVGSGPYNFVSYENNVVNLVANDSYFKGAPLIKKVKFQVSSEDNKLEAVKRGDYDISDPSASLEILQQAKDAGLHYELIDNLGYGYIGMNANRIPDKNVRKGIMSLINRGPAIESYYGELASIIERPVSRVSWAYPDEAKPYYTYDETKAMEYFTKAGYVQTEKDGKKVLAKNGNQLKIEVGIPDISTHPSGPILTSLKTSMEKMGAVLEIQDSEGNVFFDKLNSDQWDMWVAAWGATPDPDMYQLYHSDGPSNYYKIKSEELDTLIMDARSTNNIEERKELYSKALDIIMDEAVEMPVYQRKNMFVFNPETFDVDSITKDMSPFYTYRQEFETLRMK